MMDGEKIGLCRMEVCVKENEQQESRRKYDEAIKKLRGSGLKVEDKTEKGSMFAFIGGVRRPSSVLAQEEDDSESRTPIS
jgi:hypothetical protein